MIAHDVVSTVDSCNDKPTFCEHPRCRRRCLASPLVSRRSSRVATAPSGDRCLEAAQDAARFQDRHGQGPRQRGSDCDGLASSLVVSVVSGAKEIRPTMTHSLAGTRPNDGPILGSSSLSPLPVKECPASPKGGCLRFESRRKHRYFPLWQRPLPSPQSGTCPVRRPAAAHRHTVLTVTTYTRLGRHKGLRGYFGSPGCPQVHTLTPEAGNRRPKQHTITGPALADPSASTTAAPKPSHATASRAYRRSLEADRTRPRSRPA